MKIIVPGVALTNPNGNGISAGRSHQAADQTNSRFSDCVWLFAKESANGLRFR